MGKNLKIALAVLFLVVLLGSGYVLLIGKKKPAPENKASVSANKIDAPKGKLVAGFPNELILDPKAITDQSYSIKYDNQNQYTASFKSDMTPLALVKVYADYLSKSGYQIINQNTAPKVVAIYATKGTSIVNAVFSQVDKSSKTDISLTYVK